MKQLGLFTLFLVIGCARPASAPSRDVAHGDVPPESFAACADKKLGAWCIVRVHDVEALGTCANATAFSSDKHLFCDGESASR